MGPVASGEGIGRDLRGVLGQSQLVVLPRGTAQEGRCPGKRGNGGEKRGKLNKHGGKKSTWISKKLKRSPVHSELIGRHFSDGLLTQAKDVVDKLKPRKGGGRPNRRRRGGGNLGDKRPLEPHGGRTHLKVKSCLNAYRGGPEGWIAHISCLCRPWILGGKKNAMRREEKEGKRRDQPVHSKILNR